MPGPWGLFCCQEAYCPQPYATVAPTTTLSIPVYQERTDRDGPQDDASVEVAVESRASSHQVLVAGGRGVEGPAEDRRSAANAGPAVDALPAMDESYLSLAESGVQARLEDNVLADMGVNVLRPLSPRMKSSEQGAFTDQRSVNSVSTGGDADANLRQALSYASGHTSMTSGAVNAAGGPGTGTASVGGARFRTVKSQASIQSGTSSGSRTLRQRLERMGSSFSIASRSPVAEKLRRVFAGKSKSIKPERPSFHGSWTCSGTWGLDEFLKAHGISKMQRMAAGQAPWPSWEFQQEGDNIVFINSTFMGVLREEFQVGGPEYEAIDGRQQKLQCRAWWEGQVLVIKRTGPQGEFREERRLEGDVLKFTLTGQDAAKGSWGRTFTRKA